MISTSLFFALACGESGVDAGGSGGSGDSGGSDAVGGTAAIGGSNSGSGGLSEGSGGSASGGSAGSDGGGGSEPVVCPSPALPPGDTTRTITVGGTSRSYVLHVPSSYSGSSSAPLIVDFHPLGGSGSGERSSSPYPAQTDAEGVIMAFPSGLAGPMGGAWNVGPCCVQGADDLSFARALVADVSASACVDPKRVYAVGFSMGGGMSHYLACHASDLFAAVAPAAFDLLEENVEDCAPERPISVVSFRGTSDSVVPYAGGFSNVVTGMPITFLGAVETFEGWGARNGCSGSPSGADASGCQKFSGCDDGVDVVLCTAQGGGHVAGDASIAWPILKQHTLP